MSRSNIAFSLGLVALAVGVVRPHSVRLANEAWLPVVENFEKVPFASGESVELDPAGDYVVFLEAAANDPVWSGPGGASAWVQLVDSESKQALKPSSHSVDYSYDVGTRHGRALARFTRPTARFFDIEVSAAGLETNEELEARGVQVAVAAAAGVESQAGKSLAWIIGGFVACGVLALGALTLVMKQDS